MCLPHAGQKEGVGFSVSAELNSGPARIAGAINC